MVPDKFNMVDMGGIDLIMMQGEEVSGLYMRLVKSIAQCRYQCLYNWLFDGVIIPPTYVELRIGDEDEVIINEGVTVTDDDVIHIYSLAPPAPEPEIIPLLAEENGTYTVPTGKDGFNPVTVDVPSYTPVINPITITENGAYTPPAGVDGYAPVTVNVSGGGDIDLSYLPNSNPVNVLASKNTQDINPMSGFIDLSAQNTDVTCYCCVKCLASNECILMAVPYSLSNGNAPSFYTPNGNYSVDCTVFASNTNIPGLSCSIDHVYALSIDSTNRKVRYFYDGIYFMEKTFSNSGDNVCFGRGAKDSTSYIGNSVFSYIGVVSEFESDATIIANMQTIMQKLNL